MNIYSIKTPFLRYFRKRRIQVFCNAFQISDSSRILDVGGTTMIWNLMEEMGYPTPQVVILNLTPNKNKLPERFQWVVADGTDLPYEDNHFDIVFSNSVIEHLGSWESQVKFAGEIKRVSQQYFLQTPDKRFFIEPHYLAPFIHWLPKIFQKKLLRNFTVWGLLTRPSKLQVQAMLSEHKLLNRKELIQLFPEGVIQVERFLGMPKSLLAIRSGKSKA